MEQISSFFPTLHPYISEKKKDKQYLVSEEQIMADMFICSILKS